MNLEIQIKKSVGHMELEGVTVILIGSLDTATAPELENQLKPILAEPIRDLVFDLADLKFISSAGLRVFTIARKMVKDTGGQICFINLQPQIIEVFEVIKALMGVTVFYSKDEFEDYLNKRKKSSK